MHVIKWMTEAQWEEAEATPQWMGAPIDQRDGFIHLSTPEQASQTAQLYFREVTPLVGVWFRASDLDLTWDPSRGGQLFPHVYGPLPIGRRAEVRVFADVDEAIGFFTDAV